MKSLFLKIFLSFWGAQALFMVLAILVTIAMRPARDGTENMGSRILGEAVNAYATGGEAGARQYLDNLRGEQHVRGHLFDQSGRDLTGRTHSPWSGRMPPPWADVEEVRRTGKAPVHSWSDHLLPDRLSRQTMDLDGRTYTLVLELPPSPGIFFGPHGVPGLGIGIAVLSSGLVCYLLAWSLTSPVSRLRQAAQSLAAGDLSARAGAPLRGRRDELAELMRDFDRMAERIEGLMETQSRLLKDVSHELRSPLARLGVALGLARRKAPPEAESALNRIELEADRLNQLIQRLLTISRLEAGADGIHKSSVSLLELVEHVARDTEFETPTRGCQVIADPGDSYTVQADSDLLRSALENVVRNATRYTAEGTTVQIRLGREKTADAEDIVVRVLDSGPGVPSVDLEKIFQPFYRLDDARNRQTGGAGLGLSIAERAIRLHGGQVRASNRTEGGLEVEIRIPAAPAVALPAHS